MHRGTESARPEANLDEDDGVSFYSDSKPVLLDIKYVFPSTFSPTSAPKAELKPGIISKHESIPTSYKIRKDPSKPGRYMCEFCHISFNLLATSQKHYKRVHLKSGRKKCKSSKEHAGKAEFPCGVCGKRFQTRAKLTAHQNAIHERKVKFRCNLCPKIFYTKGSLTYHENATHLKTMEFACEFCGKRYGSRFGLKHHRKTKHLS